MYTLRAVCRFAYPSVFIVYQTIPTIVLGVIVLIGYIERQTLFCESQDLQYSYRNPTVFCTLSGQMNTTMHNIVF